MNRDAYLSQRDVAGFVEWAGHLVSGEWGLEHSWKGKGPPFRCHTLYEAFQNYRWPNSSRQRRKCRRYHDEVRQGFRPVSG